MRATDKISLSIPADLLDRLNRLADTRHGGNRSETVCEVLRTGLSVRRQIEELYGTIATLKARLAEAEAKAKPPPDFRDYLTRSTPGTGKLRDDLDWCERARRKAEAELAEAKRAREALAHEVASLEAENAALGEQCAAAEEERDRAEAHRLELERALEAERQRKMPWLVRLRETRFAWDERPPLTLSPHSWLHGFLSAVVVAMLALLLMPHQWWAMRAVASVAMGTWGDYPKASARLHDGPMMGKDSLVQIHALVHAGTNAQRLDACFAVARELASDAKPIPCTIEVPPEFQLYAGFVTSGPWAHTSRARKLLQRQQEVLARLEKLEKERKR